MIPIYVSYYTPGYSAEARELMVSLDLFGLRYDVVQVPDAGSWQANTQLKPGFIRAMMSKHDDKALVFVDADARLCWIPNYFNDLTCDFAAHWRNGEELMSGSLYFSGKPASVSLVEEWMCECSTHRHLWDQKCLQNVVKRTPELSQVDLPTAYCCVIGDWKMGPPVILHLQASRRLKDKRE